MCTKKHLKNIKERTILTLNVGDRIHESSKNKYSVHTVTRVTSWHAACNTGRKFKRCVVEGSIVPVGGNNNGALFMFSTPEIEERYEKLLKLLDKSNEKKCTT
jgi:hypothetical protein